MPGRDWYFSYAGTRGINLDRVKAEISAQYVDHNLIQEDFKNADDHLFLQSAAKRFGVWFSPPGNGVSHPLHMEFLVSQEKL